MNNEHLIATKKLHDSLKAIMDDPYVRMTFMKSFPTVELQPSDLLFIEPLRFMAYIADADGEVSQREVNIINYITGRYLSLSELNELIDNDRHFYIETMPEVPMLLRLLCEMENILFKNGKNLEDSVLGIVIKYFEALGILISDADGRCSSLEQRRIDMYIAELKEYALENTLSPFFVD